MIVLLLPDHRRLEFDDAEARSLADRLWDAARRRGGTATLAVDIDAELHRPRDRRQPIDVSRSAAERLSEALAADV